MHLLRILATHGGTATGAQLAAISDRHLGAAVRSGLVLRTARGRYADPRAAPELLTASALDAVVSHERAAWLWRLGVDRAPAAVRLTVPCARNRGRTRPHHHPPGPPLVCWTDLEPDEVVGRVTEALVVAAARWRGARRPAVVRVALAGDGRADNTFESVLRGIVIEAGVGGSEPQVVVEDAGPRKRVDLADRRRCVVIEADSFTWHGGRSALSRDAARYDELAVGGWLVLRFAWEHVMGRPARVGRTVREACALRDTG